MKSIKILTLVIILFLTSCVSFKIGLIDVGVFRFENIEITPIKDQKGRIYLVREINGKGSSLKEAIQDAYYDGARKYGQMPDSINQVYLEVKKEWFSNKFLIKANALY